jgi:hypothetical protein
MERRERNTFERDKEEADLECRNGLESLNENSMKLIFAVLQLALQLKALTD